MKAISTITNDDLRRVLNECHEDETRKALEVEAMTLKLEARDLIDRLAAKLVALPDHEIDRSEVRHCLMLACVRYKRRDTAHSRLWLARRFLSAHEKVHLVCAHNKSIIG